MTETDSGLCVVGDFDIGCGVLVRERLDDTLADESSVPEGVSCAVDEDGAD